ncbi:hypothetical protein BJY01DRAFT_224278 [Aspergillus pseudoustus]|uniref:Uncharacterized protein n=1 Tax=Aspergillus pseudoustus TaxID=1810923 RepID=A0ABR4J478_9EURO
MHIPLLTTLTLLPTLLTASRTQTPIPEGPGQILVYQSPDWSTPTGCLDAAGLWTLDTDECGTFTGLGTSFYKSVSSPVVSLTVANRQPSRGQITIKPVAGPQHWQGSGYRGRRHEMTPDFLQVYMFGNGGPSALGMHFGPIWYAPRVPAEEGESVVLSGYISNGRVEVGLRFETEGKGEERADL